MSTPTSETLNGGSTFTPTQKSGADESSKGKLAEMARPRTTGGDTTTGMACNDHQVTVGPIKPVDRKTITGSTPGDFRKSGDYAKDAMDKIANPPNPRQQMGQQKSSKFDADSKPFESSTAGSEQDRA